MKRICRPGSKIYNGFEVPERVEMFTNKNGREFYISGSNFLQNTSTVRYLDDGKFEEINSDRLAKYFTVQRNMNEAFWKSKKREKSKVDTPSCWVSVGGK